MLRTRLERMRGLAVGAGLSMLLALTGCGAFFQCEGKASCGTGGGSTSTGTGDYVYVSNSTVGSTYINGYTIDSGALTAIPGSPFQLNYQPVAMAVSTNNKFLYVAASPTSSSAGVWVYTISSTGAISGGTHENSDLIGAMALSPDGNWLFEVDSGTGITLSPYSLDTNGGGLTAAQTFATPGGGSLLRCLTTTATPASQSCSIAVSPNNNYVAVSLNTNGTVIYPYTSSAGITSNSYTQVDTSTNGDYSLAFDGSNNLYVASTTALTPYSNLSASSPTVGASYAGYASGAAPRSVALSPSYGYIFTANEGTGNIQAFTVSNGAITQIGATTSPSGFLGPTDVSALGVDRSGTYLLAAGYNQANGLQLLTISATSISAVTSAGTSSTTSVPVVMALTH